MVDDEYSEVNVINIKQSSFLSHLQQHFLIVNFVVAMSEILQILTNIQGSASVPQGSVLGLTHSVSLAHRGYTTFFTFH